MPSTKLVNTLSLSLQPLNAFSLTFPSLSSPPQRSLSLSPSLSPSLILIFTLIFSLSPSSPNAHPQNFSEVKIFTVLPPSVIVIPFSGPSPYSEKLGKILAIFPVMYLSGGTCAMLIITGGGTMELFFQIVYGHGDKPLTGAEWYLVFTCLAIAVAQLPNLNSIARVSLIGAITAVAYCTLIWVLSICKGRPDGVSYDPSAEPRSEMARICGILNGIGIIALAFRGHNVVLEIQGTLPSSPKLASREPMWRGVTVSYTVIAMCLFPLAVGGYWAYGNKMPANGGMLSAYSHFHRQSTSSFLMGAIYLLEVINNLSSFQIYVMVVFDNLELRYTMKKKRRCPAWLRTGFRVFVGGLLFFVAVAIPFLGSLAALIGGITLPLTFAYPCFMWIAIKRPRPYDSMWCLNFGLGCLGMVLSVLLVTAAAWTLADKGINANFFKPH